MKLEFYIGKTPNIKLTPDTKKDGEILHKHSSKLMKVLNKYGKMAISQKNITEMVAEPIFEKVKADLGKDLDYQWYL